MPPSFGPDTLLFSWNLFMNIRDPHTPPSERKQHPEIIEISSDSDEDVQAKPPTRRPRRANERSQYLSPPPSPPSPSTKRRQQLARNDTASRLRAAPRVPVGEPCGVPHRRQANPAVTTFQGGPILFAGTTETSTARTSTARTSTTKAGTSNPNVPKRSGNLKIEPRESSMEPRTGIFSLCQSLGSRSLMLWGLQDGCHAPNRPLAGDLGAGTERRRAEHGFARMMAESPSGLMIGTTGRKLTLEGEEIPSCVLGR
ncbi:hypothetical protein GCG54_00013873 [Colletotrichum gloeosporioides]|uniref:Uncharacterized protein n=1 Tax=Colletotrichum gloeosporioides TaxID=474922 RepID=A0A8H4CVI6_COLGL|nr:uncharacterized protein GCG54_00013873 [Colletotrichum gloeosporioides]KAF3810631.1 hypothetical protein GCG54_00013873 [Colletotrichum gloeosporioides]